MDGLGFGSKIRTMWPVRGFNAGISTDELDPLIDNKSKEGFVISCLVEPKNDLFLFYGKGRPGVIRGLDMNIKSSNEHMVPIEDLVNPRAIDYHAESGYIYFADTTSFLIGRQKTDGSSRETILKDGGWRCFFKMNKNVFFKRPRLS